MTGIIVEIRVVIETEDHETIGAEVEIGHTRTEAKKDTSKENAIGTGNFSTNKNYITCI